MGAYPPTTFLLGCLRFSIVRGNRTITEAILSLVVEKINREPTVYEIGVLPRKTMFPRLFPTFPAFDFHCRQPFWFITALKCHSVLYTVVPFYYCRRFRYYKHNFRCCSGQFPPPPPFNIQDPPLELDNNFIASD